MTEQAGPSSNPSNKEEPTGPPPWERKWNDVTQAVGKAVAGAVDVVKNAVGGAQMPWERSWGGSSPAPSKAAPKPPTGAWKPIMETEAKAIKAAQFTPAELKARDIAMNSPENIAEMKGEIARAKDPKIKKILETELAKLQRK